MQSKISYLLALVATSLLAVGLAGCASGTAASAPTPTSSASSAALDGRRWLGSDGSTEALRGLNHASLLTHADAVPDTSATRGRLGLDLRIPATAGRHKLLGRWISKPEDPNGDMFFAEYDEDVVLTIERLKDANEVKLVLANETRLAPHVKHVQVKGLDILVRPRLNVPPVTDATGLVQPGTGIITRAAVATWGKGRFRFALAGPDATPDELLEIVQGIDATELP
jgi:hypothetical protein